MSVSRFWWGWAVATVVVFGLFFLVLLTLDTEPRPGRLLLLVAFFMAVLALVNLNLTAEASEWEVYSSQPVVERGQDTRLAMYARVLSGHLDARDPDPQLRDRLAALAGARLRQRHGVGLRDPEAAALLGPQVVAVLTGEPRRLARGQIEDVVRAIEEL